MAAIKSKYKRFNGVEWEEYYFETSVDQVIGLSDFIKDNETKLSTNDSTATSGKYISRIQVSDHGLTITKEDLPTAVTGFSGDYDDLSNKPNIPEKTSDLINDSDFTTTTYVDDTTAKLAESNVFTQPQIVPNAENDNEAVNLGQLNTVVSIWRYE